MKTISLPDKVKKALDFAFSLRNETIFMALGIELLDGFLTRHFVPDKIIWGEERMSAERYVVILQSNDVQQRQMTIYIKYENDQAKFYVVAVRFKLINSEGLAVESKEEQRLAWLF